MQYEEIRETDRQTAQDKGCHVIIGSEMKKYRKPMDRRMKIKVILPLMTVK